MTTSSRSPIDTAELKDISSSEEEANWGESLAGRGEGVARAEEPAGGWREGVPTKARLLEGVAAKGGLFRLAAGGGRGMAE